ncbi:MULTISPECIES: nitroreductase/quinone reductase family protein [Streptomyces]|uniref:nitroreductase/quinone reductase family protein n=1 Tax=Streptomyces TaxID=1883 RepID=UPI002272234A|nr:MULTISPECIES: nitroreductase/quinone reductase family protein [unclassified Streptomyces]MCY0947230.1 nitroreductase/quinone reductase family protein [Streptomyces sp. H34-AA3]MCY0951248.1 nitroreductase/quinone reductase family protein [Streptomyces sp. H27-S2]MCZ4086382.1 nitroreductase/quinone reductase family protein [Streptomyces sp. H34-S5]
MPTSFNQSVIDEFRANKGVVGGYFEGSDLLLLTTTGAKSGEERTTPLGFVRHGELLMVIGSNLGADKHPDWYHNLLAHPLVQVEIGAESFEAIAVPAEGARRDELFTHVVSAEPGYGEYQENTRRVLPVVVLESAEVAEGEGPAEVRNLADKLVEVHVWLRAQLGHVRAEVDAHFAAVAAHQGPGEPPAPGLGLQIRQRCLAFCQSLEFHHVSEDAHMFPMLEAQNPHLSDAFERLRVEHRTVARLQEELSGLLADIAGADPERFRTELTRMSDELTAHLDYEEESLLPILAAIPFPPGPPSEAEPEAA